MTTVPPPTGTVTVAPSTTPTIQISALPPTEITVTITRPTATPTAGVSANRPRLAYAAAGSQTAKRSIFIKYLDGSQSSMRVTGGTDKYGDNFPTFSPDGKSLAFARCYAQLNDGCNLYVKNLATGDLRLVLAGHKVMRSDWCGSTASPYRDWLVFEDRAKNGNFNTDSEVSLGLVNVITGKFRSLTDSVSDYSPAWSPDCSQIVFTRYDEQDTTALAADLMLINPDTGETSPLTGGGSFSSPAEISPAWSPDGQWIAYRRAADTNKDGRFNASKDIASLWLIRPNGKNNHVVTADYRVASIDWSPDSQNLVFTTEDEHMLICDLKGQIITNFGGDFVHPAWGP
jgi:Tol biopolymer transport system component